MKDRTNVFAKTKMVQQALFKKKKVQFHGTEREKSYKQHFFVSLLQINMIVMLLLTIGWLVCSISQCVYHQQKVLLVNDSFGCRNVSGAQFPASALKLKHLHALSFHRVQPCSYICRHISASQSFFQQKGSLTAQYRRFINQRHFQCPITETQALGLSPADSSPIHLVGVKAARCLPAQPSC